MSRTFSSVSRPLVTGPETTAFEPHGADAAEGDRTESARERTVLVQR